MQLCQACQALWKQKAWIDPASPAVALTTQRSTMINLDERRQTAAPGHRLAGPAPHRRAAAGGRLVGAAFTAGRRERDGRLPAGGSRSQLDSHPPAGNLEKHPQIPVPLRLPDLPADRRFVDSVGCQVGYMPFDYKTQRWAARGIGSGRRCRWTRACCPTWSRRDSRWARSRQEACEATGIPAGLPLIAAAADKACEVLGAGCLEPQFGLPELRHHRHHQHHAQKYIEVIPLIPPYPSAVPGAYNLEMQIYRGYWMVSWFKQEFGLREERMAPERGMEPEELFDELVNSVPPGSQGLVLQPYWSPGLRSPGPEARGAIIGFGDVHTRAHIYRAILEGLAYALREGAERTAKRSGVPITEMRVAGGGSQSDAAMQLTADIFGLPAPRPHVYEASGLGAAMDAAVGAGVHPDFADRGKEMTHLGQTFDPDEGAGRLRGVVQPGVSGDVRQAQTVI